jgi:hypothetical protein
MRDAPAEARIQAIELRIRESVCARIPGLSFPDPA